MSLRLMCLELCWGLQPCLCVLCSSSSLSGLVPDTPSRPPFQSFRTRNIPVLKLTRSNEEGRELRVVVNTNDPDYEHVYSVENYDNPEEEDLYPTATFTDNPCLLPLEEGSCAHYTLHWYFNSKAAECRPFVYSGCKGNDNRFTDKEDCELQCWDHIKDTAKRRSQS
ncbi:collagen alpha-1(VII) chain isoform X2 [Erpetoichthys calabaricus]|uniref:collagen alpha-1(VII) chain isoform X2 n=1 Tax=Erpetoichthys calabaricus TaxID=27687 RepID=UPI002234E129|nr:collagen alpha-1(VII) chain isoform X2 [Erpetoichthys calabaricus]